MTPGTRSVIAINAQLAPGGASGGIEQFLVGLVGSLGALEDGGEDYVIVTSRDEPDWLERHLGPNQRVEVHRAIGPPRSRIKRALKGLASPRRQRTIFDDPFFDQLGADVVHFPYQSFRRCKAPTVFNPHDLQHLHYPEFFSASDLQARQDFYPRAARDADVVVTESDWVRRDVIEQLRVPESKVVAIHRGSPTELYPGVADAVVNDVARRFGLTSGFAFYPAQTWPHKNHIALLEALALLRDKHSLVLRLVCTGRQNDFWPRIHERLVQLDLQGQVQFLGFVDPEVLRCLYRLAAFLIFPSLFEGGGFPVTEAFVEGTPIACARATALPEYAGDAALLFEPTIEGIAAALQRMALDPTLRANLRERGHARQSLFSWDRTARTYRALYRWTAGQTLSESDHELLQPGVRVPT